MSKFNVHLKNSLMNIRNNYPELYYREKNIIFELIYVLHKWLDFYDTKKGEDEDGPYDFTASRCIRHKMKRHHIEGINEAVKIFSQEYGESFVQIIREEAMLHIIEDMGAILCAADYRAIGFWKYYKDPRLSR
jgi:hypothetical protein